jgi:hypothetical protein
VSALVDGMPPRTVYPLEIRRALMQSHPGHDKPEPTGGNRVARVFTVAAVVAALVVVVVLHLTGAIGAKSH